MKKNNKNEDRNVIYVPNKQINNQNPWLNLKEQTMFFNITKINYQGNPDFFTQPDPKLAGNVNLNYNFKF